MNRDLDAKICKDIFGWKLTSVGPDADGQNACEILTRNGVLQEDIGLPNKGKLHEGYLTPLYSGDLRLSISLAKMVGLELTIQMMPTDPEVLAQMSYDYFMNGR